MHFISFIVDSIMQVCLLVGLHSLVRASFIHLNFLPSVFVSFSSSSGWRSTSNLPVSTAYSSLELHLTQRSLLEPKQYLGRRKLVVAMSLHAMVFTHVCMDCYV